MRNECIMCGRDAGEYHICDRCYKPRKTVLDVVGGIILGIAIVMVVIILCGMFKAGKGERFMGEVYTVKKGDTAWDLFTEYGGGEDWDRWYDEMLSVNGKEYGEKWYAGERITLLKTKK